MSGSSSADDLYVGVCCGMWRMLIGAEKVFVANATLSSHLWRKHIELILLSCGLFFF